MWEKESKIVCGRRGEYSYLTATRTEMNPETKEFTCPGDDQVPCSTDPVLGGSTFCVSDINDCPITDLRILP